MDRDRTVSARSIGLAGLLAVLAIACCPVMGQGIITTLGACNPATGGNLCVGTNAVVDAAGNVYFGGAYKIGMVNPAGLVTTIAGTGQMGASGDGGPALSATLGHFYQIALSGSRLCFGDATADKIRCVDLGTGLIQGYGTGVSGNGGDGGNVSAASFTDLWGAAFDNQGLLYVSDFAASSVRRVDFTTGMITMFAGPGPGYSGAPLGDGGPALGANIYEPEGLAYGSGGLYIADAGNDRIRRVDLATGLISTVAGNGSPYYLPGSEGGSALQAGIGPRWIALDTTGNLFLGDSCCSIREVDTAGIISTIAGASGNEGIGADDIPATQTTFVSILGLGWDPVATRLLISDYFGRLRQIFYTPPTTTTLTPSENPAHWGDTVTLTAVVSPPDATGRVRFYWGYPYSASLGSWSLIGSSPIANGSATISWTAPIGDANWALSAVYGGDPAHNLSQSPTVTEVVHLGGSSTSLGSSVNPSLQGQSVIFTATVGPVGVTGTVTFLNSGNALGSSLVSGGTATLTVSSLPPGPNSITASFSGDSRYTGSTSPVVVQVVKASTTTVLTTSPNPSAYGSPVVLAAAVSPAAATGTVQFLDGSASLGTATIGNGSAALSLSNLSVGAHAITAVYGGDANNAGSASAVVTQTVNKNPSTVTVTSSPNPSAAGDSVTLSATVTPSAATGTVQFLDGSTVLGAVTVANGLASLSLSTLTGGAHTISAAYSGDANDYPKTSLPITQTVQKTATTTSITSWATRVVLGQSIPFTVAVSPATASGTVNLMKGTSILGAATLSNGVATIDVSTLPVGSNNVYAQYTGSASYLASSSAPVNVVIVLSATGVLTTTPNPSVYGAPVTLTLTVTPAAATGPVQFNNGDTILGTANLVGGRAKLTVSKLPVGSASLIAYYDGDAKYVGFTSLIVTQIVNRAPTSMALTSSKNPSPVGGSVTFTAAVSPSSATGTVQFLDGSTALGTLTIGGGAAALSLSTLSAGAHSIKAVYSGDTNYAASTSTVLTQTVSPTNACHVDYKVTTQWNVGFQTAITIQNTGTAPVSGWNLTWTWAHDQKITESWNSIYSQSGANAKLTNASYNAAIASGATISGIGFNASYSGVNTAPTAFYLNGALCK